MKKLFALVTACVMLMTGCASKASSSQSNDIATDTTTLAQVDSLDIGSDINDYGSSINLIDTNSEKNILSLGFKSLDDIRLSEHIENTVRYDLLNDLGDDYTVESVNATYISKEYLDEVEFNSQANIYFGYTEEELAELFVGTRYIFTLDDEGETTVKSFEPYTEPDQTFNKVLKNVAIGAGVILLCVTVSAVSAGVGAPAISMIFAASAKSATIMGLETGVFGGLAAGVVTGIKTGDFDQALKNAALAGSEGFKWGAITGAIMGGIGEASKDNYSYDPDETILGSSQDIGKAGEKLAEERYPGEPQVSYLNREIVPHGTPGSQRPDILVKNADGSLQAIEVKTVDLNKSFYYLKDSLKTQISERIKHLPEGTSQKVVLVTKGRGYTSEFIKGKANELQEFLSDIYHGPIPIDIIN